MINLETCIICGSSESLNTSMTVMVDDETITIKVCDEHAEDITPKLAKQNYLDKKSQVDDLIKQAQALGLTVSTPDDAKKLSLIETPKLKVETRPTEQAQAPPPMPALRPSTAAALEGDDVISTDRVDDAARRVQGMAGGDAGLEQRGAYDPASLQDKLDPALMEGKVKMDVGEGRGGQPIAVPSVRVDGRGTTTIRIKQAVNDDELQRRFKANAGSTDEDGANKHAYARGYDVHPCPICRGECAIPIKGVLQPCPKCEGSGLLPEV